MSCQRLANSYNDLTLRCGKDAQISGGYHWVESQLDSGDSPKIEIQAAGFRADGTFLKLPISSRNCVGIPEKSTEVTHISILHASSPPQGRIMELRSILRVGRIRMEKLETSVFKIRCSELDETSLARQNSFDLLYDKSGDANLGRYRMKVRLTRDKKPRLTDFVPISNSRVTIDLSQLEEGIYSVEAETVDMFGFNSDLIVGRQRCELNVDRKAPVVQLIPWPDFKLSLMNSSKPFRVNSGQRLEYKSTDASEVEVLGCWIEEKLALQSCQPFQKFGETVKVPADGTWQLQYYGIDRAGNKSPVTRVNFEVFNSEKVNELLQQVRELSRLVESEFIMPALEKVTKILLSIESLGSQAEKDIFENQLIPYLSVLQMRLLPRLGYSFANLPLKDVFTLSNGNFLISLEGRYGSTARLELRSKSGKLLQFAEMGPCRHQIQRGFYLAQNEQILNCEFNDKLVLRDKNLKILSQVDLESSLNPCTDLVFTEDGMVGFLACPKFFGRIQVNGGKIKLQKLADSAYQYLAKSVANNVFANIDFRERTIATLFDFEGTNLGELHENIPIVGVEGNGKGTILCAVHVDAVTCRSSNEVRKFTRTANGVFAFHPFKDIFFLEEAGEIRVYDWMTKAWRILSKVSSGSKAYFKPDGMLTICVGEISKVYDATTLNQVDNFIDDRCWLGRVGKSQFCIWKGLYFQQIQDCTTKVPVFPPISLDLQILAVDDQKNDAYVRTKDGRLEVLPAARLTPFLGEKPNQINSMLFAVSDRWVQANPDSLNFFDIKSTNNPSKKNPSEVLKDLSNLYKFLQLNPFGVQTALVGSGETLMQVSLENSQQRNPKFAFDSEVMLVKWLTTDRIAVLTNSGKLSVLDAHFKTIWSHQMPDSFVSADVRIFPNMDLGVFALTGGASDPDQSIVYVWSIEQDKILAEFHSESLGFVPSVGNVQTLNFSKDGRKILIGFHVNAIIVWNLDLNSDGKTSTISLGNPQDTVFSADFFAGDRSAYHMSWDGTVAIHELEGPKSTFLPTVQPLWRGRFVAKGNWFVNYSSEQELEFLKPSGERLAKTLSGLEVLGIGSDDDFIYMLFNEGGLLPIRFRQSEYLPKLCSWLSEQMETVGESCRR